MPAKIATIHTPLTDEAIADLALERVRNMRDELRLVSEKCSDATTEAALYAAFECIDEAVDKIGDERDRLQGERETAEFWQDRRDQRETDIWQQGINRGSR